MNLYLARDLARSLMKQHGLGDWHFAFDHARRRFGSCQAARRLITLSRTLTFLNSPEEVRDTILHEIAHALTPRDGHGRQWKATCVAIGAKPERCYQLAQVITPPSRLARYQLGCPKCGWKTPRFRQPTRKLLCRACRSPVVLEINTPQPSND